MERARALLFGGLRPARPRLADVIEAVSGIDRAAVDAGLASERWRWTLDATTMALDYVAMGPGGRPTAFHFRAGPERLRDCREAWEVLAGRGVIPEDWVGTGARRFETGMYAAAPPSMQGVVSIASDPEGVLDAERLAREFCARLRPWGGESDLRPLWRVFALDRRARRSKWFARVPGGPLFQRFLASMGFVEPPGGGPAVRAVERVAAIARSLESPWWGEREGMWEELLRESAWARTRDRVEDRREDIQQFDPAIRWMVEHGDGGHVPQLAAVFEAHRLWQAFEASGASLKVAELDSMGALAGQRSISTREIEDPFEPLLALLERGYWLFETHRRSVVLGAVSDVERTRVDDVAGLSRR
jgi:hypothetical protein